MKVDEAVDDAGWLIRSWRPCMPRARTSTVDGTARTDHTYLGDDEGSEANSTRGVEGARLTECRDFNLVTLHALSLLSDAEAVVQLASYSF